MTRAFTDYPPELQAAVTAYDDARRDSHGGREAPMSDANKATIAPMIMAAVRAYVEASAEALGGRPDKGRAEAWAEHQEWISVLKGAGFDAHVISHEGRHCRTFPRTGTAGWFDFWPSTGRWLQSQRPEGVTRLSGYGLTSLVAAMMGGG